MQPKKYINVHHEIKVKMFFFITLSSFTLAFLCVSFYIVHRVTFVIENWMPLVWESSKNHFVVIINENNNYSKMVFCCVCFNHNQTLCISHANQTTCQSLSNMINMRWDDDNGLGVLAHIIHVDGQITCTPDTKKNYLAHLHGKHDGWFFVYICRKPQQPTLVISLNDIQRKYVSGILFCMCFHVEIIKFAEMPHFC